MKNMKNIWNGVKKGLGKVAIPLIIPTIIASSAPKARGADLENMAETAGYLAAGGIASFMLIHEGARVAVLEAYGKEGIKVEFMKKENENYTGYTPFDMGYTSYEGKPLNREQEIVFDAAPILANRGVYEILKRKENPSRLEAAIALGSYLDFPKESLLAMKDKGKNNETLGRFCKNTDIKPEYLAAVAVADACLQRKNLKRLWDIVRGEKTGLEKENFTSEKSEDSDSGFFVRHGENGIEAGYTRNF